MEAPKRRAEDVAAAGEQQLVVKKQKLDLVAAGGEAGDGGGGGGSKALVHITSKGKTVRRTSSLDSPIMLLSGHEAAVNTLKINPEGTVVASAGDDKCLLFWNVQGECENFAMARGHKNTILELHWTTDGSRVITASPDHTVRAWDTATITQVKKMAEHSSFVNSCSPSRRGNPLVVSGSDDGTAKVWDLRVRGSVQTLPDRYQITSVSFSDSGDRVFSGGVDNLVKVWDLRQGKVAYELEGHSDTITGMRLSPDGSFLLTNAMDNTLRMWDVRPFAPGDRCVRQFTGHRHGIEKSLLKCDWAPSGRMVTAGSSDNFVVIWDTDSAKVLYRLPGHKGAVNEAAFHPREPIIASGSSDKTIYLGEILATDQ